MLYQWVETWSKLWNHLFQELKVLSHIHTVQTKVDKSERYYCDNNMETLDDIDLTKNQEAKNNG